MRSNSCFRGSAFYINTPRADVFYTARSPAKRAVFHSEKPQPRFSKPGPRFWPSFVLHACFGVGLVRGDGGRCAARAAVLLAGHRFFVCVSLALKRNCGSVSGAAAARFAGHHSLRRARVGCILFTGKCGAGGRIILCPAPHRGTPHMAAHRHLSRRLPAVFRHEPGAHPRRGSSRGLRHSMHLHAHRFTACAQRDGVACARRFVYALKRPAACCVFCADIRIQIDAAVTVAVYSRFFAFSDTAVTLALSPVTASVPPVVHSAESAAE